MSEPGLIHRALEQELLGEIRRRGLVVWLDKDGSYTPFVNELIARHRTGDFPHPVVGFRGSFLELLFQLEPYGDGTDLPRLLVHLPGHTQESVRQTPLLELYEPALPFRKALDTLVRETAHGRVAQEDLAWFLASSYSLAEADSWLSRQLTSAREGLAGMLEQVGLTVVAESLLCKTPLLHSRELTGPELEVLQAYLHRQTGLDEAWLAFFGTDPKARPLANLAAAFAGWILSVEYVHDLARAPHLDALKPLAKLSDSIVAACRELAQHLRARHPDTYVFLADDTELHLGDELSEIRPEDFGKIDTFRREESRLLEAAIQALCTGEWTKAQTLAAPRTGETSFWLQRDQVRRFAWTLVGEAAGLGDVLARHPRPLQGARGLTDAVERYTRVAFEVDRAHRRFEQQRLTLMEPRLPHFGALQEAVGALRRLYRTWADALARDFSALCREQGFLPDAALQQRHLYEQVVHPLTQGSDKVACFLIDAFRYEMATELLEELKGTGTVVDLKARLAELPSLTSVGMNALAPVARAGRLHVAGTFQGFRTVEFTVRGPEDRARAMGVRSVGRPAQSFELAEICEMDSATLARKVAQSKLLVVHSREIDDAGEASLGLATFELTLRQIQAAWRNLHAAGVKQFVFTADHGFLLQDETTAVQQQYGSKKDPSRRHVLAEEARGEAGMVNVSLSALGYEGASGYLLFREDTAVFATGKAGAGFVHGGNSPQERIIPVLTVTLKRTESVGRTEYLVQAEPLPDILGLRRLRLRAVLAPSSQGSLGFVAASALTVGLRVPERSDIRVALKDAGGAGSLRHGQLQVSVGEAWTEIVFSLEGPRDERVRVEAFHPDNVERVAPCTPEAWFNVEGTATATVATAAAPPSSSDWQGAFGDEGVRKVFLHLAKHGAINEAEATRLIGSPRALRRFSLEFEEHARKVPFKVRIEAGAEGKRYVREGEK